MSEKTYNTLVVWPGHEPQIVRITREDLLERINASGYESTTVATRENPMVSIKDVRVMLKPRTIGEPPCLDATIGNPPRTATLHGAVMFIKYDDGLQDMTEQDIAKVLEAVDVWPSIDIEKTRWWARK